MRQDKLFWRTWKDLYFFRSCFVRYFITSIYTYVRAATPGIIRARYSYELYLPIQLLAHRLILFFLRRCDSRRQNRQAKKRRKYTSCINGRYSNNTTNHTQCCRNHYYYCSDLLACLTLLFCCTLLYLAS